MTASHPLPEIGEFDDRLVDRLESVVASEFDTPGGRGERRISEFAGLVGQISAQAADELEVGSELGVLERVDALAEGDHERVDSFVEGRVFDEKGYDRLVRVSHPLCFG